MILSLLLAVQAAEPSASDLLNWPDPPTEMVDFLGRRRLCAVLGEPEDRASSDRTEAIRLRCESLPDEERAWRARYADNAAVRAWLDLDPIRFRLNQVVINSWHGPPEALPRRIEQQGVDARTGEPYRLVIESAAAVDGTTRITASFAGLAPRSFTLDNARFPLLDLQSLLVALGRRGERGELLYVMLRYGYPLGYCSLSDADDRPQVSIAFERERISASRPETINCETSWTELPDAAAR